MKKTALILAVILFVLVANIWTISAAPPVQESQGTCTISSPSSGVALRGAVPIIGTVKHPNFTGYQIGYAPDPNPTGEWTFFANGQAEVDNGQLGVWNTAALPDGVYQLIVEVFRNDGNKDLCFKGQLRVNNTAPTPTFTAVPLPTAADTPTALPEPTDTPTVAIEQPPTSTPRATPTYSAVDNPTPTPEMTTFKLPIELGGVKDWSCKGAQAAILVIVVVSLYFVIRNLIASGVRKVSKPQDVQGFHRRHPREY